MKIRIVGGPVEGKVEVETLPTADFATIMVQTETIVGKGPIHDKYQFHKCEIVDKKAKAGEVLAQTDSPQSVGLPASGAILMLKLIHGSPAGTPRDAPAAAATSKSFPAKKTYRERLIAIYEKYDAAKVNTVDGTLEKFKGKEEAVIKKLVEKYGPEPGEDAPQAAAPPPPPPPPQGASGGVVTAKSYRQRIYAIYEKYEPSKLNTVDSTIEKFKGKEEAVIKKLIEKYGPEPVDAQEMVQAAPVSAPAAVTPPPPPQVSTQEPTPSAVPVQVSQPAPPATANESTPLSYRDRLIAIYQKYDAAKVGTVDGTLEKFKGKEEAVIKKLVEKYGPEPVAVTSTASSSAQPVEADKTAPSDTASRSRGQSVKSNPTPPAPVLAEPTVVTSEANQTTPRQVSFANPSPNVVPAEPEAEPDDTPTSAPHHEASSQPDSPAQAAPVKAVNDPRYIALVASVLRRAWEDANNHTLRHRWSLWKRHALEQKAEKLIAAGKWRLDPVDGQYSNTESNPPFKTRDLVTFLSTNEGTARSQVLSDAMCDALRTACRLSCALIHKDADSPTIPVVFHDNEVTVVKVTSEVIPALELASVAIRELDTIKNAHRALETETSELRSSLKDAIGKVSQLERVAARTLEMQSHLEEAREELTILKKKSSRQEDEVRLLTSDLSKAQKELEMERRGLPTDMELVIKQKDARLAFVEQELAKHRLKVKELRENESQFQLRIAELQSDVQLLERSRGVALGIAKRAPHVTSVQPSTRSISPKIHSPSQLETHRSSIQQSSPRATSKSPPKVPRLATNLIHLNNQYPSDSEVSVEDPLNFEPTPKRTGTTDSSARIVSSPQSQREMRDLALRSEILLRELSQPQAAEDAGRCPHCTTSLTPLRNNIDDHVNTKRAFCFSCRRSFSQKELHDYLVKSKSKGRSK